jgi:hypothetical protein
MRKLWIIGLLALLLASCIPLQITNVKLVDEGCNCVCLSWQTNQEAVCKVTYCEETTCFTSPMEPEYGTLHSIGIPPDSKEVTITAIGRNGQAATVEVK